MFCRSWWWRGHDNLIGTSRNDWLFGGWRDNTIDGRGGNDIIWSSWGNDTVSGGEGNDWIWSGHGNDSVKGDAGRDFIRAGSGKDTVDGGTGDDYVNGGRGGDSLTGGAGNDKVYGGHGNDELVYTVTDNVGSKDHYNGGSGSDLLVLRMTHAEYAAAKAELDAFDAHLAESACGWKYKTFHFQSFDLEVKNVEQYQVVLTDEPPPVPPVDPNVNPEAIADSVSSGIDGLSIQDTESNDPNGTSISEIAQAIDRSSFRVEKSAEVGDDSLPRVSIHGGIGVSLLQTAVPNTNDVDVYSVELKPFEKLILDIDHGYEIGGDTLWSWLFVLDENGNELARNDTGSSMSDGGEGSSSMFDPYLTFENGDTGGTYYIAVSSYGNEPGSEPGTFTDGGLLSGDYVLNVSIENPQSDIGALVIEPEFLLGNDSDANGDVLEITGVGNAKNGDVQMIGSGKIQFKPATSSPGSFDYTVSDGNGGEATATVTVNGNAVVGTPSDDVLEGTSQSDLYTGGGGNDTFNFASGSGTDTISDFEFGSDAIAITDGMSIAGTQAVNNDTLVEFDTGDSVLLVGVTGVTDVNDLLA